MNNCLFCKIVKEEITAEKIYENNKVLAFKDINPQAPEHFLVITKKHFSSINDIEDENLIGMLNIVAVKIAKQNNFAEKGYRLVINCNKDGAQSVPHIHLHCLAGRQMHWPPG